MKKTKSKRALKTKSMREVGIGLVGAGFMGRIHANAWRQAPLFFDLACRPTLAVVASGHARESSDFAAKWGVAKAASSWDRLIKDPTVALVDVCVPNNLHAEVSMAALKAGKHVACEKPLGTNITEAREMALAALGAKNGDFNLHSASTFYLTAFSNIERLANGPTIARLGAEPKTSDARFAMAALSTAEISRRISSKLKTWP